MQAKMNWNALLELYRSAQTARRLSPNTVLVNYNRLLLLIRFFGERQITPENVEKVHIETYLNLCIEQGNHAETVAGKLRTFAAFFTALIKMDVWERQSPVTGIAKPRAGKSLRNTLSIAEFGAMLKACNKKDYIGHRNYLLLLVIFDGMLRRAEAAGLRHGDLFLTDKRIRVTGKGNKTRLVPLSDSTIKELRIFLTKRCGDCSPTDFVFQQKNGKPLGLMHVRQICWRTAQKAGIQRTIGCHVLRHAAANAYLSNGGAINLLSQILGHESLETTMIYQRQNINDLNRSYLSCSPLSNVRI